ncbi:RNase adapter RapZ [Hathewaya histolytica]|uniref:ATP-binding protein n=1 Tax=Hathewaya histolytica TaxID=1498 RepID=A0A4U9R0V2_HATHI|nr:RNase adapter RapZ [Hathewaya histolytica]VTQ83861.1 ATP-binding protein [Hathewaya histolytica]
MNFVIVSGLSGAGKTQAMRALEDLGYFCVDNLPPTLIPKFAEACGRGSAKVQKIALAIDIRGGEFFEDIYESFNYLTENEYNYEVLFLEANDDILVKRYKESRRKHPLAPDGRILTGITSEREKLRKVRDKANNIINTTKLSTRALREKITQIYEEEGQLETEIIVTVLSFGFKYGIPVDSDLVFDVRFLPNPFYINSLKPYSGLDSQVRDYVFEFEETNKFVEKLVDMLQFLIPNYKKEGKRQLIVSIGCTGGRHRSVAITNRIYELLGEKGFKTNIDHRDINEDANRGVLKL